MKKRGCFVLLFSLCYFLSYGQAMPTDSIQAGLKKNIFHASMGAILIPLPVWGAYGFSYERMIFDIRQGSINSLWARVALGEWGNPGGSGPYQMAGITMLTGGKNRHFEVNLGAARMYDQRAYKDDLSLYNSFGSVGSVPVKSEYIDFFPVGSLGYRFQKPGGHFLFRCGLGYPDGLYVSLGLAF